MAKRKVNNYIKLKIAKVKFCKGKIDKTKLNAVKDKYVASAVKKGKTKSEALKIAGKVLKGGCSTK